LDGVTIAFEAGKYTAIMGPSGSGKSTLMHCLAGLDSLTSGAVYIGETYLATLNDKQLTELRRKKVGFIFQAYNLIPTLNARENIMLPLMLGGDSGDKEWIDEVVKTVGLADRLKHRPSELSGGQQQRVAVARALAAKPDIIFADEPTGNLDSHTGAEILDFMRRAVREYGQTIVMVTHDPSAAALRRSRRVPQRRPHRRRDGRPDGREDPRPHEEVRRMSTQATVLIARRSIRARLGRLIAISIAILVGVAFVVGSFVLADSLRKTFDDLFTNISQNVDLQVRASVAFGEGDVQTQRDPIPTSLLETVRGVDGVQVAEGTIQRYAQIVTPKGEVVKTQGAPTLGVSWSNSPLSGLTIKEGSPPTTIDQVAIDKATADREALKLGDKIQVITDTGTYPATITALVGLGDTDGFAGATLAAFDPAAADTVLGANGTYDAIDIKVDQGVDPATVLPKVKSVLPQGTEVVTRQVVIDENKQAVDTFITAFGTGLLIFAFITAFVSAFLINNVFQITIGQRLRELAMMRAIGAKGSQVRRLIYTEAPGDVHRCHDRRHRRRRGRGQAADPGLQLGRRRVPEHGHRPQAVHDRHGVRRGRRHHDGRRSSSRRSAPPGSRRSRRCAPSSGSKR